MKTRSYFGFLILVLSVFFVIPAASAACDLTGTWDMASAGEILVITQSGSTVHADSQYAKYDGTLVGNTFTGRWSEGKTLPPPKDAGGFVLTVSDDCASFKGTWGYDQSSTGNSLGGWRRSAPKAITTTVVVTTKVTTVTSAPGGTSQAGTSEFTNENIYAVNNGPSNPTFVTFATPVKIISVTNYHWNDGKGASPGSIGLEHSDGTIHGYWSASGQPGQGGVPNANWIANPSVTIKAGTYTVLDSDPSTWAQNTQSGNAGMTRIVYLPVSTSSVTTITPQVSAPVTTVTSQVTTQASEPGKGPDLIVTSVEGPITALPGEKITITDTVRNQGGAEMKDVYTYYYLSTNNQESRSGTMLPGEQHTVSVLSAGADDTGSVTVTIPADIKPGIYYLRVNVYAKPQVSLKEDSNPWNNYIYAVSSIKVAESGTGQSASESQIPVTGGAQQIMPIGSQRTPGKYSSLDALAALQMSVGKRISDTSYDLISDGKIDSKDAREILRLAVNQ